MAEFDLSTLLSPTIQKLASATLEKPALEMGIHSDLQKLKASLSDIRDLLDDASKREITDGSVKRWLNRFQDLAYDVEDILDDLLSDAMWRELTDQSEPRPCKVRKLISKFFQTFSSSVGMKYRLVNLTSILQDLEQEIRAFGLIGKSRKPINMYQNVETGLPDASPIVGRDEDKEKIVNELLWDEHCDKNFSIVPIVGIAGIGKTVLARLVYNKQKVIDHFDIMTWVWVPDKFDIVHITKIMYQNVTGQPVENLDLNLLQKSLREEFSGKRILLVIDNVWCDCPKDWHDLLKPFHRGASGSKIIMTTRKETLLDKLRQRHRTHLEVLPPDKALSLLALHALGMDNFDSHPVLKPYGEDMVKKCGHLPLALKELGRSLGTNSDEDKWKEVLSTEIWEVEKGGEILSSFRASYHDLSTCLKRLFKYCSLFPKGYLFDKEDLLLQWMAQGYFHQSPSSRSMESWGRECFDELLSKLFFQHAPNVESLYVMPDLMNDLATLVAGDFFLRLDNGMEKEYTNDELDYHRHLSIVCKENNSFEKFAFKRANNLRSFLALSSVMDRTINISHTFLAKQLTGLRSLRVLSLSYLSITELPESIGESRELRYLNLSHTGITHIPERVCNLYHLQTLIISGCDRLTKFPNSFFRLKNLRHLNITGTQLASVLPAVIFEWENLEIIG